jgi:hypothetical protein
MTGQPDEVLLIAAVLLAMALAVSVWALVLEASWPKKKSRKKPERETVDDQMTVASIQERLRQEQLAEERAAAREKAAAARAAFRSQRRPAASLRRKERKPLSR